jgi:hypothetical protein
MQPQSGKLVSPGAAPSAVKPEIVVINRIIVIVGAVLFNQLIAFRGMKAAEALAGHGQADEEPVFLKGLFGVGRTGGVKIAGSAVNRRDDRLKK